MKPAPLWALELLPLARRKAGTDPGKKNLTLESITIADRTDMRAALVALRKHLGATEKGRDLSPKKPNAPRLVVTRDEEKKQ